MYPYAPKSKVGKTTGLSQCELYTTKKHRGHFKDNEPDHYLRMHEQREPRKEINYNGAYLGNT